MRKLFAPLAVVAVTALVNSGCETHTATNPNDTSKTLTLTRPSNVTITQGDTSSVDIKISRKGFNEAVNVRFEGLPEGVTVQEQTHQIAKDSTSTTFNLKAAPNAPAVTDKAVTVTASGGGTDVRETFNVSVRAK